MYIRYGTVNIKIDVSKICFDKLLVNGIITIPSGDQDRAFYFTDPIFGQLKKIFIDIDDVIYEYDYTYIIKINVNRGVVNAWNPNSINQIHNVLKLKYGSFTDELPEQQMVLRHFTGEEKVLEIGSNIGRNSLIIAYILAKCNNNNFVTLESDTETCNRLIENRNLNNFKFAIENSALSKRKLIQRGWDTIQSDVLLHGCTDVHIISLEELYSKYDIEFDTLVLDCEGAFYYILKDMPELLNNIKLIVMENDYRNIEHKIFVDEVLVSNNFYVEHTEIGGWGPCEKNFYEVWKKK